jgi:hypothetical protein
MFKGLTTVVLKSYKSNLIHQLRLHTIWRWSLEDKRKKKKSDDNIPEVQTTFFWVVSNPSSLGTGFLAKSSEGNTAAAGIMSFFCFLSI